MKREYAVLQRTDLLPLDDADRDNVRRLAADLPALWRAATTTMMDRKRLLRLVVTEVTLATQPEQRRADVKVLWYGGAGALLPVLHADFGPKQRVPRIGPDMGRMTP